MEREVVEEEWKLRGEKIRRKKEMRDGKLELMEGKRGKVGRVEEVKGVYVELRKKWKEMGDGGRGERRMEMYEKRVNGERGGGMMMKLG